MNPTSRPLVWIALLAPLAAALAFSAGARAQPEDSAPVEGLLLGVRTRYDFNRPQPTTYSVTADGIRKLGEGLAVVRRGGVYWVGNVKEEHLISGATPTLEEFAKLVVSPPSRKPKAADRAAAVKPGADKAAAAADPATDPAANPPADGAAPAHSCDDDGGDALTFASGELLSFQTRRVSYCGGAAPETWGDLTSWRLGASQPARVTAGQALGTPLGKALFHAGCANDPKCDLERYGDPDEKMWGLVHDQGVWVLEGGRPRTTGSNNPSFGDFTYTAPLPKRLVGPNALHKSWAEYGKLDPTAVDVVDSPSGRLAIFFDHDAIRLFVDGREKEKVDFADPQVVMTQWAIGPDNVARWIKDAKEALAE